ncbi:MAG: NAD(P)H-hydrate dehydratase [Flavipsychrobacter sp.]|nr:NAD(P)H-hydrate dehydratase [Flavipsychrobacter sp.]
MKILSAAQVKAADAYTIAHTPISSLDLMERAAAKCVEWLLERYPRDTLFLVLCGSGNNGGDGLAIARMLHREGYGVKAFYLPLSDKMSADCRMNYQRLERMATGLLTIMQPETYITDIAPQIVIIDALFGTGLTHPAGGWLAKFINAINALPNEVVAIDLPSGLAADSLPGEDAAVINAAHTLSFQLYKRSFLHPEGGSRCGQVHILDIGLSDHFIAEAPAHYHIAGHQEIQKHYRARKPFTNKGTYGLAFLVGGSYGMAGAVALATRAALRAGAGKVRALLPGCGYTAIQTLVPEAMCLTSGEHYIEGIHGWEDADAIGIGCGMGTGEGTVAAFGRFLEAVQEPIVLDADALNIMALHPELLTRIPAGSILTPHPKEFDRLFGPSPDSMQRVELARMLAMRYNFCIVLKDRHTATVAPDGTCWYNTTGNAGLATAGSGDVLAGIITGLLAQGYATTQAALLGVYLHGKAGEYAAAQHSMEAMVAGDIVEHLGSAFRTLGSDG